MKKGWFIFFLLLFGITGYLRERFFEHLNIIMAGVYRGTDEYAIAGIKMPAIMSPFNSLSYETLYYSKYLYTLVSAFIFFLISRFALKKLTGQDNLLRILSWSYLIILVLAGISMTYGYLVKNSLNADEYTLSRWLLGIAQSPLICLILIASNKLNTTSLSSKNQHL
jgi:hypothetical protein